MSLRKDPHSCLATRKTPEDSRDVYENSLTLLIAGTRRETTGSSANSGSRTTSTCYASYEKPQRQEDPPLYEMCFLLRPEE